MNVVSGVFTFLGSLVSGFFGIKKTQGDILNNSLKVLSDTNASNAQREQAIATIIAAEAQSGYWLAAVWRPLLMVVFALLIVSFWFGYVPPNLTAEMPPILAEIFTIIKIGIAGYIPSRTVEKIASQMNIAGILKKYIEKTLR